MDRDEALHPSEGARFVFEREQVSDDGRSARYRTRVFTASAVYAFEVALDAGGGAELRPVGDAALDADLAVRLRNLARSVARAAGRRLGDQLPPWPHRIQRWRGPGR